MRRRAVQQLLQAGLLLREARVGCARSLSVVSQWPWPCCPAVICLCTPIASYFRMLSAFAVSAEGGARGLGCRQAACQWGAGPSSAAFVCGSPGIARQVVFGNVRHDVTSGKDPGVPFHRLGTHLLFSHYTTLVLSSLFSHHCCRSAALDVHPDVGHAQPCVAHVHAWATCDAGAWPNEGQTAAGSWGLKGGVAGATSVCSNSAPIGCSRFV